MGGGEESRKIPPALEFWSTIIMSYIHYYCLPSCCEMHRPYITPYYVMKWTSMVIVIIGTCMYHDLYTSKFLYPSYHACTSLKWMMRLVITIGTGLYIELSPHLIIHFSTLGFLSISIMPYIILCTIYTLIIIIL